MPKIHTAWISILAPRYQLPAHSGVTEGNLRAHLGLIVPREREKCRIRIVDEIRYWEPGKIFVIDDTYEHEVWSETNEERVVLLLDFNRPMRLGGRLVTWLFFQIMKLTAFYQEPKRNRSEEHTSELQSLMRISYAVFCLKKKKTKPTKKESKGHAAKTKEITT